MHSDLAVHVEHLSKRYRIGGAHGEGLWRSVAGRLKAALRPPSEPPHDSVIWALQDVSFSIPHGEVFGIIGTNGSGKSTLLKILSRVTIPTKGRAVIHGRFCGLLEVGTGFHPELTGRDNIYMSGAILGMKRQEIANKFDEIVAFAEVESYIDTPVKHYSSGMYVRLGFSVLAHMDPDVLIVDEVLAVGDVRFQKKCMTKMEDVRKHGRTVILVSHDMSAITRLCRRALLLNRGRVIREGPAHEVVNHYLFEGHIVPSREWSEAEPAPGNEAVRMRAVRIKDEHGQITNTFDIRQAIVMELEYEVLQPGTVCLAAFSLLNEDNVLLFKAHDRDPEWERKPRPPGRYLSTAWIPGNILSEGVVTVNAGIVTEQPFRIHCEAPRSTRFRVHENGSGPSARGDFSGRWTGAVRPLLRWVTEFTPMSYGIGRDST